MSFRCLTLLLFVPSLACLMHPKAPPAPPLLSSQPPFTVQQDEVVTYLAQADEAIRRSQWRVAVDRAEKGIAAADRTGRAADPALPKLLHDLGLALSALHDRPGAETAFGRALRLREQQDLGDENGLLNDQLALARLQVDSCRLDAARSLGMLE